MASDRLAAVAVIELQDANGKSSATAAIGVLRHQRQQ